MQAHSAEPNIPVGAPIFLPNIFITLRAKKSPVKHNLSALFGAIAIGSVGIWVNLIGDAIPIMTVNFLRVAIAAVILAVVGSFFGKGIFKLQKKEVLYYLVIGVLIGSAMSLFNIALHYLTITQTYLLDALFPFFVLVFAGHVLKDGIRASDIIALLLGAVAIAVLNPLTFKSHTGLNIMFVEVILYSLMVVYMKREGMTYTLKGTFWMFFFASLLLLPGPILYGFGNITSALLWVALLGGVTGIGYVCFNYAIVRMKTEGMSIFLLLGTTIFAMLTAVIIFGETLPLNILAGAALLLFSGSFLQWMRGYGHGPLAKIIYYAGESEIKHEAV